MLQRSPAVLSASVRLIQKLVRLDTWLTVNSNEVLLLTSSATLFVDLESCAAVQYWTLYELWSIFYRLLFNYLLVVRKRMCLSLFWEMNLSFWLPLSLEYLLDVTIVSNFVGNAFLLSLIFFFYLITWKDFQSPILETQFFLSELWWNISINKFIIPWSFFFVTMV